MEDLGPVLFAIFNPFLVFNFAKRWKRILFLIFKNAFSKTREKFVKETENSKKPFWLFSAKMQSKNQNAQNAHLPLLSPFSVPDRWVLLLPLVFPFFLPCFPSIFLIGQRRFYHNHHCCLPSSLSSRLESFLSSLLGGDTLATTISVVSCGLALLSLFQIEVVTNPDRPRLSFAYAGRFFFPFAVRLHWLSLLPGRRLPTPSLLPVEVEARLACDEKLGKGKN